MSIDPSTLFGDISGTVANDAIAHPPVYNVKAYGAVGDGVADDRLPIQDAIDAASTARGTVVFPVGVYRVAGTLQLKESVSIVGERSQRYASLSGVVINHDPAGPDTDLFKFEITPTAGTYSAIGEISGLFCQGTANSRYGMHYIMPRNLILRECTLTGFDTGLFLQATILCLIEDCLIEFNRNENVFVRREAQSNTTCRFHRCYFRASAWGMRVGYHTGSLLLQSCVFESCTSGGIDIENNLAYVLILDSYFEQIGTDTIPANTINVGVNGPGPEKSKVIVVGGRCEGVSNAHPNALLVNADMADQVSFHGVFFRHCPKLFASTGNTSGVSFTACVTENVTDISPLIAGDGGELQADALLVADVTTNDLAATTIASDNISHVVDDDNLGLYGGTGVNGGKLQLYGGASVLPNEIYISGSKITLRDHDFAPIYAEISETQVWWNRTPGTAQNHRIDGQNQALLIFVDATAETVQFGEANTLFVDCSSDNVSIGTASPNTGGTNVLSFLAGTPPNLQPASLSSIFAESITSPTSITGVFSVRNSDGNVCRLFQQAALTAIDNGVVNSGDAATDAVIENNRTRIVDIESRLKSLGLLP